MVLGGSRLMACSPRTSSPTPTVAATPRRSRGRCTVASGSPGLVPGFETWLRLPGTEEMRLAEVNGQPGAVFLGQDGRAVLIVSLDIADGFVRAIRAISDPEKLCHIDPMARRPGPLAR